MNKTGKIILITLILAGAGVGGYFLYKKLKKDSNSTKDTSKKSGSTTPAITTPTSSTSSSSSPKSEFPLKKGSKGPLVRELQTAINVLLPLPLVRLTVDGDFGTKTETALNTVHGYPIITKNDFDKLIVKSKTKQGSVFFHLN